MRRKPTPQPLTLHANHTNRAAVLTPVLAPARVDAAARPPPGVTVTAATAPGNSAETLSSGACRVIPATPISQPSPQPQPSPASTGRRLAVGKRPPTARDETQSGSSSNSSSSSSSSSSNSNSAAPLPVQRSRRDDLPPLIPPLPPPPPQSPQPQSHRPHQDHHHHPNHPDHHHHHHPQQTRDLLDTPDLLRLVPSPYQPDRSPTAASPASASPASRHATSEGGRRPGTRSGFFHFNKSSSKGSGQLHTPTSPYPDPRQLALAQDPEGFSPSPPGDTSYDRGLLQKPNFPFPSRSDLSLPSTGDCDTTSVPPSLSKKGKSKSFGLLSRSRSNGDKEHGHGKIPSGALSLKSISRSDSHDTTLPLRTAPIAQDRGFRDMMNSSARNRSQDGALGRDSSRDKERGALPATLKDNGSNFLSGLRHSSTKAADIISKGLFGKGSRSGSTLEREPVIDDEHYVLKVINLPLVQQTRLTRISKRLESSKDKTEFWMPAFPWRAIDYLNYKGCDVEGLYRVPGSGPQIKKWQRKFDEQYDVNLFEEDSLYDINIIGSMLKAWLRELPDELFPKEAQDRIARECSGATEVPQLLIEELSNLSPFNYYLLFAITCHLSLLLAHSDKNKMDFRNLCICFQPCMKIDAFCFKFLVCDWRNCWKGCRNEVKFIEEEYRLFDQPPPRGITEPNCPSQHEDTTGRHQYDDAAYPSQYGDDVTDHPPYEDSSGRQQSSLDSSKPSNAGHDEGVTQRQRSVSNASVVSKASSISTNMTVNSEEKTPERIRDIRPLSPIKPLSPIGF